MKKTIRSFTLTLVVFFFCGSSFCYGQTGSSYLIKGKIKNFRETLFEVTQEGYLFDKEYNVVIENSGNFSFSVPIEGIQNLYVHLNDESIKLFAIELDRNSGLVYEL